MRIVQLVACILLFAAAAEGWKSQLRWLRNGIIGCTAAAYLQTAAVQPAALIAAAVDEPTLQIVNVVTKPDDLETPALTSDKSALYITAREETNVFQSGVLNSKTPAVLTKRIPGPVSFPYEFKLEYSADRTPEGTETVDKWSKGKALLLSARLDTDGVAATRDATDLVGKGTAETTEVNGVWKSVNIDLSDRGIGGKLVTRKQQ